MRRSSPVRFVQVLAAAVLTVGVGGLALSSGAGAQVKDATTTSPDASNQNTYDLSAQSNALDVLASDPSFPEGSVLTIEGGPYGASASLNSLGISLADAGAPYSPFASSLPGTISGLGSGFLPPLPPLPGYVAATYPGHPTSSQTQGGYQISSTASASDAKGTVTIGVQPAGSPNATMYASAETAANSDGSVSVQASAGLDALSFGQLFDLANVSSSVSLTQQSNGQPTVKAQTNLGTVTLLGQATGLHGSGLSVLGLNVPIDLNGQIISTLNTLLGSSGIKIAYLPETITYTDGTKSTGSTIDTSKTLQSIDSGALKVTAIENLQAGGILTANYILGRVYVSTTDSPGFALPTGDTGASLDTGGDLSIPTTAGSLGTLGSVAPLVPSVSPTTTASTPAPSSTPIPAVQPTYALAKGPSVASLYLMLILVALALLLGSQAVRVFSVRLALSGSGSP
jgi:hypothetical protein